jgi:hypothetical protein
VKPSPAASDESGVHPLWREWGRQTRFLESARLVFARERNLWASLDLRAAEEVQLSATTTHGTYRVGLTQHLAAVHDEETLLASVLMHSYAFAEAAAAERLGEDAHAFKGIEDWGERLLATTGSTWECLSEGLAGAVEVAIVRNAYAHASSRIDGPAARRLCAAGTTHLKAGDNVSLDYRTLKVYRGSFAPS